MSNMSALNRTIAKRVEREIEESEFKVHPSFNPKFDKIDPSKISITLDAWESDLFDRRFAKKVHDLELRIHILSIVLGPDADMSDYHDLPDYPITIGITGTPENIRYIINWIGSRTTWL